MKYSLKFKNESFAQSFCNELKTARGIEASINKADQNFVVAYEVAEDNGEDTDKKESICKDDVYKICAGFAQSIYYEMQYTNNYFMRLVEELYKDNAMHREGHLPPIMGAGKMKAALETLGIAEDYTVAPKYIFASSKNVQSLLIKDIQ